MRWETGLFFQSIHRILSVFLFTILFLSCSIFPPCHVSQALLSNARWPEGKGRISSLMLALSHHRMQKEQTQRRAETKAWWVNYGLSPKKQSSGTGILYALTMLTTLMQTDCCPSSIALTLCLLLLAGQRGVLEGFHSSHYLLSC